jgi:hypothetical protein
MNAAYLPLVALVLQDITVPVAGYRSAVAAVEHRCPEPLLRLVVDPSLR